MKVPFGNEWFSGNGLLKGLFRSFIALVLWSCLPGLALAAQRTLTVDGVRVAFNDVSTEVDVYFRSMRFNRALSQWNVEATVSNKSTRAMAGPLVLLVESAAGTSGVLQPDGTDSGQAYFDLSGKLGDGVLSPSETSLPRTLSLGFTNGGTPQLVTRVFLRAPPVLSPLGLTRSLDEVGHPLPGVQVNETGPVGPATRQTDPNVGVVTLGQGSGEHTWKFSADGYLPVWRHQALVSNTVTLIPNPRLVPRAHSPVTVTPGVEGVVSNTLDTIRLTFGAGSLTQPTPVTLTPLTAQTLPGLLPLGWSPLQACCVEWDGALAGTAQLRWFPWGRIEFSESAVLARWTTNAVRWEVVQSVPGNIEGALPFGLSDSGTYALVVADSGVYAPPPVVPGQPLPAATQPIPDLSDLTAGGTVTPPSSAASRNPELVTATATVGFSNNAALPSGLLLRSEVSDTYDLNSGTRLTPPRYDCFVAAYQRPGDGDPNTLGATFPMRPLLLLVDELTRATVTADVLVPGPFRGGVLDTNGGVVWDGAIRLFANAGDLTGQRAVELRQLDPADFPGLVQPPQKIVAAFELQAESLPSDRRFILQFPAQSSNSVFVLARVLARDGLFGLEPVERFNSDGAGKLVTAEPGSGERLPGVTGAGQYVLIHLPNAQGLLHGVASDGLGQPKAHIPVRVDGQPWLTFSAMDGSYKLLAPAGAGTLAVVDLAGGSANLSSFVITNTAAGASLDVSTVPSGPRVTRIAPADGATNVTRVTQVVVEFSKPVNPAAFVAEGLQLLDQAGQPAAGAVSLNLANTVATLLPNDQLAPNALYQVVVSTNVTDRGGRALEGPNTAQFTTQSAPLNRSGAALTSYEPVNGQATLVGTPGTAEANSPVILVNETSGRTATVISRPDGGFSNSIPAEVDDTLSAVMVNQNGTRNSVAVSRQIFADGSVGLFSSGGMLQVTNENGVAQFIIEPGAIEQKTVFKVEAVSLQDTRTLLGNAEPTNGMALAGFKFAGLRGSSLKHQIEVIIPVNPDQLGLPLGMDPTNATFGLAIARIVEGEQVFQLVDSLNYEHGRLVTHSWGEFLGFLENVLVVPLVWPNRTTVVHGRVYSARVDLNNNEIGGTDKDLPGAIVRSSGSAGLLGQLVRGMVYAVSSTNGHYSILAVTPTLSATHPLFPRRTADVAVPVSATIVNELNLRFSIPASGSDVPPELIVTHLPPRQDPGLNITNTVIARGNDSDALADVSVISVMALTPGQTVTAADIAVVKQSPEPLDPPVPFAISQRIIVSSPKAALVHLVFSAVDGNGNKTTLPYVLQFSGQDLTVPPGPIPGSDFHDQTGPRVQRSIPETPGGVLMAGSPITIKFDEPIKTNILQQPAALTIAPACKDPVITLSDDQTVLTLRYYDLQPGTDYKLALSPSSVEDLYGNHLDQDPIHAGDDEFVLSFTTGTLLAGALIDPIHPDNEGIGAVANGHYAFVLDRSGPTTGRLLVYDLRDPQAPPVSTTSLAMVPRDLFLIPHYSFYYAPTNIYLDPVKRRQVTTNDFTEVLTKDLLAMVGGIPGQTSVLRVYDVSDPTQPQLLAATKLSPGDPLVNRVRWSAPKLGLLEVGQFDRITLVDLQSYLIGQLLAENPVEYRKLGNGRPGRDDNLDGDYTDPGEEFPLPPAAPAGFPGKQGSLGIADSTQGIREFAIEERGAFLGAIVLPGDRVDGNGTVLTNLDVPAGYRTLMDHSIPVLLEDGFFPITNGSPRRLFTLFKQLITAGTNTTYYDLAFISVNSPPGNDTNHVLVLNLTNRLAPTLLLDIPIPKSAGLTNLYSIVQRGDGLLVLASDTNCFLIDPAKFGAAMVDTNKAGQAVVGMIPGAGGDAWTFGISDSGAIVSGRAPTKPRFVVTPPIIEIVSFPEVDPFVPNEWLSTLSPATVTSNVLHRLSERELAIALRLARYQSETGYCLSTLKDITATGARSVHYYALVKTLGGDPNRDYIDLSLESLNWAGAPLKKRGFLFPPVHAFSADVLKPQKLDQEPNPTEDASVRTCRAWRLSSDPGSPLFDMYLSRPFALVGESLSQQDLGDLDKKLNRDILWSGNFLRVSIDPWEADNNPALKPFAGQVLDGRYHPGVFTTLPSLPGEFLQSPNPMPIRGGATIGLAGGFVGAHNSELIVDTVDLTIPGRRLPVSFGRHYSGQALYHGPFGRGWDINYNQRLVELSKELIVPGYTNPVVVRAHVSDSEYATNRDILFYNAAGRTFVYKWYNTNPPPEIANDPLVARLKWVEPNSKPATNVAGYYLPPPGLFSPLLKFKDGRFATLDPDGTQRWFNEAGRFIKIYDRWETNSIELSYGDEGELISIRSDGGTSTDPFRLYIGYFRNPNATLHQPADLLTNVPSLAGRICRLVDPRVRNPDRRDVVFTYNGHGDLDTRSGVQVKSVRGPGVPGRQRTQYAYDYTLAPRLTAGSLSAIRGPSPGAPNIVVPSLSVDFEPTGTNMVGKVHLGTMEVAIAQTHKNSARELSAGTGHTEAKGPPSATPKTIVTYDFDTFARTKLTTVKDATSALATQTLYDTNGLLLQLTFPESNYVQYVYDTNAASLRSQANLTNTLRNPGPRGGPTLSAGASYDPHYNLLSSLQSDFAGNQTQIDPDPSNGSRSIWKVTKGGETEETIFNEFGQLKTNNSAAQIQTRMEYTKDGFLEKQFVGDVTGSSPPLETIYTYAGNPGLQGLPTNLKDPTGVTNSYFYDELERLIESTRSDAIETLSYDGAGNLSETTRLVDKRGAITLTNHFYYDDFKHLVTNVVDGIEVATAGGQVGTMNLVTAHLMDEYYRVTNSIQPSGEQQVSEFDFAGRLMVSQLLTNGPQAVYRREFQYDGNGNLVKSRFNQATNSVRYDGLDRPIERNSPAGAQTTLAYDKNDNVLTNKIFDTRSGNKLLYSAEANNYDALDRPATFTLGTEAGPSTTDFSYDTSHRSLAVRNSRGATTTYKNDRVGLEWSQTGPLGVQNLSFNPLARELAHTRTDGLGPARITSRLSELGFVDKVTDANSKDYTFTRGVDGRVLESRLPTSAGATDVYKNSFSIDGLPLESSRPGGEALVAQYDARGNPVLEAVRFPGGAAKGTTYSYDGAGRLSGVLDADNAGDQVADTDGDGLPDFNEYGQPTAIRLARGFPVELKYDAIGRLTNTVYSTNFTSRDYDALNRVTRIGNANGALETSYGIDGLPASITNSQFGTNWTLPQHFNTEGARLDLQYPDRTLVSFGRDSSGRLLSIKPAGGDHVVLTNIYGTGAIVTERTLGKEPNGLIDLQIGYDGNRKETNRTYRLHATHALLAEVVYLRNDAGVITNRQYTHAGTVDYFDYDGSQRLTNAVIGVTGTLADRPPPPGTIPPGAYGRTFQYSPTDVLTNSPPRNPHQISLPAFVESVKGIDNTLFASNVTFAGTVNLTRSRDAAGNTSNGRAFVRLKAQALPTGAPGDAFAAVNVTYTYNELDQLVLVQRDDGVTVANTYGPHGLRIRRTVQGPEELGINSDLEYLYDGINLIEIHDFAHARELRARFYYGDNGDELLSGDFFDPGSSTPKRFYYLTDSLGSPMAIVDGSGNVVEYYLYDAWGEATIRPPTAGLSPGTIGIHTRSAVASPFYFQGQVYDEDAGLIYMRARFYDPALGVFLQRDPSGYEDSGNQYAGLASNPVNYRDPSGKQAGTLPEGWHWETYVFSGRHGREGSTHFPWKDAEPAPEVYQLGNELPGRLFYEGLAWRVGEPSVIPTEGLEALSAPPLVQSQPRPTRPPPKRRIPAKPPGPAPVQEAPAPKENPLEWELRGVERKINQFQPELEKTRHEAMSTAIDTIPVFGFAFAALFDFVAGKPVSSAGHVADEGLEKSIERTVEHSLKKELFPGWTGPKDAWELHEAMMAHGENAKIMQALKKQRYELKIKLGMPDARYDLPTTHFYLGPKGVLYDKRTGRPAPQY